MKIKEFTFTSFDSKPLYFVTTEDGASHLISLDSTIHSGFDHEEIVRIIKSNVLNKDLHKILVVDQNDSYYQDRTGRKPLLAILALAADDEATRYYIDPKTASVVGRYGNRSWVKRWLYHRLHSLNFPFLYNRRPLWDIVIVTFMIGGTALCVTSLIGMAGSRQKIAPAFPPLPFLIFVAFLFINNLCPDGLPW